MIFLSSKCAYFLQFLFVPTLRIFQYFSVDNDVFVKPIHEEQCQPSTSQKEDNNTHSASAISAKQRQANEEKRISKKLPEVKVSSFLLGGHHQTDFLLVLFLSCW